MSPSQFSLIPTEAVVSNDATCSAVLSSLKHKQNLTISTALMDKANLVAAEDNSNPYRAQAYRRAAILVARSEIPLLNKTTIETWKNWQNCRDKIGLPSTGGSSTSDFVYRFIALHLLQKTIFWSKFEAFPPEWRDESLMNDYDRICLAKNMIYWLIHPMKSTFWRGIHSDINYKTNILYRQAYDFYSNYIHYSWNINTYVLLEFLQETINTLLPH
jgi:hypothetical protein